MSVQVPKQRLSGLNNGLCLFWLALCTPSEEKLDEVKAAVTTAAGPCFALVSNSV